ncbi:MAG: hypothetical protein PHT84_01125 [Candidatus Pacebacteria bacterium]|nr:hypothetical protein [Candidatus Paceibacterota bacterium]
MLYIRENAVSEPEQFKTIVTVSASTTFYAWTFRFAGQMKIAGPENVKQEYLEMAKKVLE